MKFLSILMSAFILACSSDNSTKDDVDAEKPKSNLKVMTYNIHIANPPSKGAGFVDINAIANVINTEKPDLVALQEVDRFTERSGKDLDQAKAIADQTNMYYYFAKALNRSGGDYGVAILSKYPLLSTKQHALPGADGMEAELRTIGIVEVTLTTGEKVIFGSTHIDHKSDDSRRVQAREIITFLKPYENIPIILGGDFNMTPENEIWNTFNTTFIRGCTVCPGTFPAVNANTTIDYILLNKVAANKFTIKDYYTVEENYASDHLPLIMELEYSTE
ncbi:endonuclease/exonuclease/phosphatase family protein [Gelidibacter maritimus]|uniref:Endonuclease/exonuclease/phosphatase family protein n=1 Tax=Gelidibacter maritimus TaxID=2761487 RepID=A0A7W2M5J0_9FLAO|nr:endonuclease/exonuclease/phosphatase family protein [Gelidibacter maritimus]MBA6153110.1 endonuclease/exonuclease/phosphatase family protein [Gelidibacter maritimus]